MVTELGAGRQDNTDTAVTLSKTKYNDAVSVVEFVPLSIVADEGGLSRVIISRVIVEIGTAANPTTPGEKGVESVSVVDNVITIVTYSEGATWQQRGGCD